MAVNAEKRQTSDNKEGFGKKNKDETANWIGKRELREAGWTDTRDGEEWYGPPPPAKLSVKREWHVTSFISFQGAYKMLEFHFTGLYEPLFLLFSDNSIYLCFRHPNPLKRNSIYSERIVVTPHKGKHADDGRKPHERCGTVDHHYNNNNKKDNETVL